MFIIKWLYLKVNVIYNNMFNVKIKDNTKLPECHPELVSETSSG